MSAAEFWDACSRFDWFYEMSDDHSVWQRGVTASAELLSHAPMGSRNREIYNGWVAHVFSGPAFDKPKAPQPERPS